MLSIKAFEFLIENRMRNSRDWFLENKDKFNQFVYEPLQDIAIYLEKTLLSIDDLIITTPKTDKTISRVYRDTRFSKDKSIYREEMWLSFKRDKKHFPHYPEFFFVISPDGFCYGCGYYAPTKEAMDSLRNLIITKDKAFKSAFDFYKNQCVYTLDGDKYKKSKFPDLDLSTDIKEWTDRKSISLIRNCSDLNQLFSDDFAKKLAEDFLLAKPAYDLFIKAEEIAKSNNNQ